MTDTCKRCEAIAGHIEALTALAETFTAHDKEVSEAYTRWEASPFTEPEPYHDDRDDAGVELARAVPELLALLAAEGTYKR